MKNTMRIAKFSLASALALALSAVVFTGCQQGQSTHIGPESHFAYPNSNVTPLGPVKVKVPGGGGLLPPMLDSKTELTAYNKALAQASGADLIIDYIMIYKTYSFVLLPFYWSDLELEGTAAKMQVGKQVLK